jgi:probable rRNA maturation factor
MQKSQIEFHAEGAFILENQAKFSAWFEATAKEEGKHIGSLNYIFCDDEYLIKINVEFLNHDTYTDIITFDYSVGDELIGDLYISTERVSENAKEFKESLEDELNRVLIHGLLHLCGYKDKTEEEAKLMRTKENYYLSLLP